MLEWVCRGRHQLRLDLLLPSLMIERALPQMKIGRDRDRDRETKTKTETETDKIRDRYRYRDRDT